MLLSISTTHQPATDLGYLLAKHPQRCQQFPLGFGQAQVWYPQADVDRCEAMLYVDVDPVDLVRGKGDAEGALSQYVNDRPYAASSFLSVAIARVYASALGGDCKGRPELAQQALPLVAEIPVLRSRGGADWVHRCFGPLGHEVETSALPLDATFPEWGDSAYLRLRLSGTMRLASLLQHLYVLLPAIDGDRHHYIGDDEVDKLVAKASEWLPGHPERDWIVSRYLKRRRSLVRAALARLTESDETELEESEAAREAPEQTLERPLSLNEQRLQLVAETLRASCAQSVVDLGCGEGRLLARLLDERRYQRLLGVDVSLLALERAAERLKLDRLPPLLRARIDLKQGSLTYRDARLAGFDAACAVEVIEHLEAERLLAFETAVFAHARPALVLVTTPNAEYNARFETLPAGRFRHPDHRFEWTRAEFHAWADGVAARHGYAWEWAAIGAPDDALGPPTQMAAFRR
ncbi:MAG: 3' terminal RNA ribose 2'-O-methyltransferase Hen1 [Xanthomonadales bacterium]|nr:hypothetical protein [Xanthomonadales bacterium]MCC6594019.1 3' terminal RNA ribose 2'-O-methyltransferase Hen1 [Xanthomonadales bacterium]MCE7932571.1 3' terminal RNA ribose 2'-O-methyltransferase Hen1 [Xanthomonadales bacterium PRO6]